MKYIIIHSKDGDDFTKEYDDKAQSIEQAMFDWSCLTEHDKKHTTAFYVLEIVNPDEGAINHFDGNVVWDAMAESC